MESMCSAEGSSAGEHLPRDHESKASAAQEVIQLSACDAVTAFLLYHPLSRLQEVVEF